MVEMLPGRITDRERRVIPWLLVLLFMAAVFLPACQTTPEEAKSFRAIFDHYREIEGVTAISFPPSLAGLFLSGDDPDQAELKGLMQELSTFRMLTVDKGNDTLLQEMNASVTSFTGRNEFQDLFRIQAEDDDIFIRIREEDGIVSEAVMMVSGEDGFFVMQLKGEIRLGHFTSLAESGNLEKLTGFSDLKL